MQQRHSSLHAFVDSYSTISSVEANGSTHLIFYILRSALSSSEFAVRYTDDLSEDSVSDQGAEELLVVDVTDTVYNRCTVVNSLLAVVYPLCFAVRVKTMTSQQIKIKMAEINGGRQF